MNIIGTCRYGSKINRTASAYNGWCIDLGHYLRKREEYFKYPIVTIAGTVRITPGSGSGGKIITASATCTNRLVDITIITETAGSSIHVFMTDATSKIRTEVDPIKIGFKNRQVKIKS